MARLRHGCGCSRPCFPRMPCQTRPLHPSRRDTKTRGPKWSSTTCPIRSRTTQRPQLIVTRRSRLRLVPLTGGSEDPDPVYVQDNESPQVLRLLEQSGSALVRLRHGHGARVVDLLAQHLGRRIRPTSTTRVSVSVDGERLEPSDAGMLLVTEERLWLLDLIAALVELRSGNSLDLAPRPSERQCPLRNGSES